MVVTVEPGIYIPNWGGCKIEDDIARYMNISKATMYKYFSSKEEIIQYIVQKVSNYI